MASPFIERRRTTCFEVLGIIRGQVTRVSETLPRDDTSISRKHANERIRTQRFQLNLIRSVRASSRLKTLTARSSRSRGYRRGSVEETANISFNASNLAVSRRCGILATRTYAKRNLTSTTISGLRFPTMVACSENSLCERNVVVHQFAGRSRSWRACPADVFLRW